MLGSGLKKKLLAAAFVVPLGDQSLWTELKFNKIKPNQVSYLENKISIQVEGSASPLIYKLPEVKKIQSLSWDLEVEGKKNKENGNFEEDSYFRLGLVATGTKTLNRLQRLVAAEWVRKMFDLSPKGVGLDKIYFFNLTDQKSNLDKQRIHPKSEYMFEKVISVQEGISSKVNYRLINPLDVAALWISVDGDDTHSKFKVLVKEIKFNGE
jgi:hypothetical protein